MKKEESQHHILNKDMVYKFQLYIVV